MWSLETFVADCRNALDRSSPKQEIGELMARAMRDTDAVRAELGVPEQAGIVPIYTSHDLTIINLAWAPSITLQPHNHEMWAVIGIYGGREDNIFWRRTSERATGAVSAETSSTPSPIRSRGSPARSMSMAVISSKPSGASGIPRI
jgi:predicted metal-dependent enzyme (double-stranded beta helix superfamily)